MAIAETPHYSTDAEAYAFIDADGLIVLGVATSEEHRRKPSHSLPELLRKWERTALALLYKKE